ncbi:MAG: cyclic-di-AMP receptor [Roseiflexaceae bacterium]|nr:cyclic-di-AMP receptor [Roseiflexaceae bacterium]
MRLAIAVVQKQDAADLVAALTERNYRVTRISSEGGFLREGNVTLLVATETESIEPMMRLIREHCITRTRYVSPLPPVADSGEFYTPTPIEVQVGGATVFVLKAGQMLRL